MWVALIMQQELQRKRGARDGLLCSIASTGTCNRGGLAASQTLDAAACLEHQQRPRRLMPNLPHQPAAASPNHADPVQVLSTHRPQNRQLRALHTQGFQSELPAAA